MTHYSLKSFLRQAPNVLLQRHLTDRQVGEGVRWQGLAEENIEPIFEAIEAADEKTRQRIECEFHDTLDMGCKAGIEMLIEEGRERHHKVDLAEALGKMGSHLEAAYWTSLEHPDIFDVAKRFHHADTLPRWRKRIHLPDIEPSTDN